MKRILSFVTAACMALGLSVAAFAEDYRPAAQVDNLSYAYTADAVSGQVVSLGTVKPSDKLVRDIPLVYGLFDAEIPEGMTATDKLTRESLRTAGLEVHIKAAKGRDAVKSAVIDNANGVIRVTFADSLSSADEIPFDITILLSTRNGKRYESLGLTFTGTLANEIEYVYADDDYIDLSDGRVVEAYERVNKIEVYVGQGVSIFSSMTRGKKYYGTATLQPDSTDNAVFDKYADVEDVINLTTQNLKVTGNVVKIDADFDFYVYNGDLDYLGRTSEMLPYSGKYYLASEKLDVGSTAGESSGPPSENEEPSAGEPGSTGDDGSTPIYNDRQPGNASTEINPDTGDHSLLWPASLIAAASLVVVAALARKKKTENRK